MRIATKKSEKELNKDADERHVVRSVGDWDITSSWGSGKISIIEFTDNIDLWEIDDADPISQMGNNGDWLKKKESVSPKSIKNIQIFTKDLLK